MTQQEYAKVWQVSHLQGLELLQATFTTHSFPKHFHESYGIGLSERGSGIIYCQGTKYLAPPDHLIFFHPGAVHSGYANDRNPWTYRMMYLDLSLISEMLEGYSQTISFPDTIFSNRAIAKIFNHTHKLFSQSASKLEHETILRNFVQQLAQQAGISSPTKLKLPEHKAIKLVKEYLDTNYQKNISIRKLCKLTGFSPNYLITAFCHEVGIPPHSYQLQVRVQRAKNDLLTHHPLAQIAAELGFCDQSHFTRCFKRIVGVTPGIYRQSSFIQDKS
ncbi:MAG: AraC family transcriptional regulator [Xenococcaceae cyanobacterium]